MMPTHDIRATRSRTRIVCSLLCSVSVICGALLTQMKVPVMAEDQCKNQGITVRNATMLDLWYKKDDGTCSIWIHEHLFTIREGERVKIFSDMSCQTPYCTSNPDYKDCQSADSNGDCFVNISPNCNISDR